MDDTVDVTRSVELDLQPDEVWELIGDGDRWTEWMVDEAAIEVGPGETGTVTDDGQRRAVRIDRVDVGQAVAFEWWPAERRDLASTVELNIVPAPGGAILEIVESLRATGRFAASTSALAWQVRTWRVSALRQILVAA